VIVKFITFLEYSGDHVFFFEIMVFFSCTEEFLLSKIEKCTKKDKGEKINCLSGSGSDEDTIQLIASVVGSIHRWGKNPA